MTKKNKPDFSAASEKPALDLSTGDGDDWEDALPPQMTGDTLSLGEDAVEQDDFTPLPPGTVLGSYRVEVLLGKGGMGAVYRGTHIRLQRRVALKVLHPELVHNSKICARFFAEARAVNQVRHANVVEVTDIFDQEPVIKYFIMEYLAGTPLSDELKRRGALPLPEVLHLGMQMSDALQSVHAAGIVHRDLKPGNLFLLPTDDDKTRIKILDFGVAKNTFAGFESKTASGVLIGTPQYMSPEQLNGQAVSPQTDVYALGLILYEMAVGKRAFSAKSFGDAVLQHMTQEAPHVSAAVDVPTAFDDLVQRCLQKDPALRPSSMNEVYKALQQMPRVNASSSNSQKGSSSSNVKSGSSSKTAETGVAVPIESSEVVLQKKPSNLILRRPLAVGIGFFALAFVGIMVSRGDENVEMRLLKTEPPNESLVVKAKNVDDSAENVDDSVKNVDDSAKNVDDDGMKKTAASDSVDSARVKAIEALFAARVKAETDAKAAALARAKAEASKRKKIQLQTIAEKKVQEMTTLERLKLVQECAARTGGNQEACAKKVVLKARRVKSLPLDEARAFPGALEGCAIRCAR